MTGSCESSREDRQKEDASVFASLKVRCSSDKLEKTRLGLLIFNKLLLFNVFGQRCKSQVLQMPLQFINTVVTQVEFLKTSLLHLCWQVANTSYQTSASLSWQSILIT